MAAITDLGALAERPLFEPVAGWLQAFGGSAPPDAAALNAALAGMVPPESAGGAPIRFVRPEAGKGSYEERVFARGEVETRPGNWHDFFIALAWLAYPRPLLTLRPPPPTGQVLLTNWHGFLSPHQPDPTIGGQIGQHIVCLPQTSKLVITPFMILHPV